MDLGISRVTNPSYFLAQNGIRIAQTHVTMYYNFLVLTGVTRTGGYHQKNQSFDVGKNQNKLEMA